MIISLEKGAGVLFSTLVISKTSTPQINLSLIKDTVTGKNALASSPGILHSNNPDLLELLIRGSCHSSTLLARSTK